MVGSRSRPQENPGYKTGTPTSPLPQRGCPFCTHGGEGSSTFWEGWGDSGKTGLPALRRETGSYSPLGQDLLPRSLPAVLT